MLHLLHASMGDIIVVGLLAGVFVGGLWLQGRPRSQ